MFALGHLGLGKAMATPIYRRFTRREQGVFLVGTLLPDLIDKPLYYGASWWTGHQGEAMGLISGTHTFGHTAVFLLALWGASQMAKVPLTRPLALGVASHLGLDLLGLSLDHRTILWPVFGWRFSFYPFTGVGQHLETILRPVTLAGEVLGGAFLVWSYRRGKRGSPPPRSPPSFSSPSQQQDQSRRDDPQ